MTCQFWNPTHVAIRIEELLELVRNEEARLSDWRRNEAIYLALSKEEIAELRALRVLQAHFAKAGVVVSDYTDNEAINELLTDANYIADQYCDA